MFQKDILVAVDYSTWRDPSKPVPSSLVGISGNNTFSLVEVLLNISFATRHPTRTGMSVNDYWAFLRYINCFEDSKDFKLNKDWKDVDAHQKTILSDDFGMGFALYYLTKKMNLLTFVDTTYFLKHLPSLSTRHKSKNGPSKSPDFILMDEFYNIHLLECKGTQHSLNTLTKQMNNGIPQKQNINDPFGIVDEKLVTGLFIPNFNSSNAATFRIIDPEFALDFSKVSKKEIIALSLQGQMAKELHLFGLNYLANKVANSDDLNEIRLNEIIEAISSQDNVSYQQEGVSKMSIFWEVQYNLSFLRKYDNKKIKTLYDLIEWMRESSNIKSSMLSRETDKGAIFESPFGLTISAERQM